MLLQIALLNAESPRGTLTLALDRSCHLQRPLWQARLGPHLRAALDAGVQLPRRDNDLVEVSLAPAAAALWLPSEVTALETPSLVQMIASPLSSRILSHTPSCNLVSNLFLPAELAGRYQTISPTSDTDLLKGLPLHLR